MKNPSAILPLLFASLLGLTSASAGGEGWTADYDAALKQAAEGKKSLLIDFTGSDWCGWCVKLNKEVFSHEEFKTGVKDTFVLVEIDFPRDKTKLSEATIAQNETLKKKYAIKGYPTILLTDEAGKPFARTGYQAGGPAKYVEHLNELLALRSKRDAALAEANKLEGVGKAKALVAALESLGLEDEMVAESYADEIAAIKAADPTDEAGFIKGLEAKKNFAKFQDELNTLGGNKDFAGALKLTEDVLAGGGLEGEQLIQTTMIKAMIQMQLGRRDEALKTLDAAKGIDPASPLNARIEAFRKRIAEAPEETKKTE